MHSSIVRFGISVLALCLCCFCQKGNVAKDTILKIGHTAITKQAMDNFQEAKNMYPASRPDYFAKTVSDVTFFMTIAALYENIKSTPLAAKLKSSNDWRWKQMYYPAQLYMRDVIHSNLGFTDKDLEAYYKAHREQYKKTITITPTAKDTLNKAKTPPAKRDSVFYSPFLDVKDKIQEVMFLAKYPPPDSLYRKNPKDTTKIDSASVQSQWIFSKRREAAEFFLREAYREKYKTAFPDSTKDFYGEGKLITPADMKVIMSWIPESQRGFYSSPGGTRDMAKWLLRWKLFSEKSAAAGIEAKDDFKAALEWMEKIGAVYTYVDSVLLPSAEKSVFVDSSMCAYVYWDEHPITSLKPDSFGLSMIIDAYKKTAAYIKMDSVVYEARKKLGVTVYKNDYKDDMDGDPAKLIMHADSLRDTGNTSDAEAIYEKLTRGFQFTQEGMRSLIELAKIYTERQQYTQAIKKYRDYLVLSKDKSKRCNTFFMIGFIYDEYLNRSNDARINYRWVLKNTPDCELTDDAEFMSLHLGEAMNSVEELRAEAMRQGKKVDTSSIVEPASDTVKKAKGR